MNDDDLRARLEAWAAATDPAADPITADQVEAARDGRGEVVRGGARPRRLLAAAATLLVVLGLGAALAVTRGAGGRDEVVADDGRQPDGPHTQIVVHAPDLEATWAETVHRFSLVGPGGTAVTGPLEPGTSLIVDQTLVPGRWDLAVLTYHCLRDAAESCGALDLDGVAAVDVAPGRCDVPLDVSTAGGRIIVEVAGASAGPNGCAVGEGAEEPELTVPPAWSIRPELPWSCGNATFDADMRLVDDPVAKKEGFECFQRSGEAGIPVEISTVEIQRGDGLTRSWWRVLAEPGDGHAIEVLRDRALDGVGGFVRVRCDGIAIEEGDADGVTVDGGIAGYRYIAARPLDCTEEEPLPLDLPPLAGAPDAPIAVLPDPTAPSGTSEAAAALSDTIDVVLDIDRPPTFDEGSARRWSISIADDEIASGALTEIGGLGDGRAPPDVQLVGDDVPIVDEEDAVSVTVEDYDCYARETCRADGMGPTPGARPATACTGEAPRPRTGSVLVLTLLGESCAATWSEALPALTVPPAWSRRPISTECAALHAGARWGQCLADVAASGEGTAEWTARGDGLRTTFLVDAGVVRVVRHLLGGDGVGWTTQTCTGVEPTDGGRGVEPVDCGPEEEMPLTPP